MNPRHTPFLLFFLPLLALGCSAPKASVTPALLQLSIDGKFGATESGASTSSDFDSLGLDDSETSFYPRADLSWIGMHLSLSSLGGSFEGSGELEGTITLNGTTISAGADVDSSFDFRATSAVFTWDVVPIGLVELGLGLGLTVVDFDILLDEIGGPGEVDSAETFPVPLLAARLAWNGLPFEVQGSLGLVDVSVQDGDLTVIDLDVFGAYHLFGGNERLEGALVLGYRSFDVEASYDDGDSAVDADVKIGGPYVGLKLSF